MAVTRPDQFSEVRFKRVNGVWTTVTVYWREEFSDGTSTWERERQEEYLIADLPAQTKADLLSAWNGMKAHRDVEHPIT